MVMGLLNCPDIEERQRAGGSYAEGAIGWGFKPQPIESTV
jgi:hypothetical protein